MTSFACVCAATLLWLVYNWLSPDGRPQVQGPQLASVIVVLALMDVICDINLVPRRLEAAAVVLKRIYEVAVAILLLEVGVNSIWRPVVRIIYHVIRIILIGSGHWSEMEFRKHEEFWVGCVTMPLSLIILAFVGQATDHFHLLHGRRFRVQTKVQLLPEPAIRFLNRSHKVTGLPLPHYVDTLQRHKEAATRRRRGQAILRHFKDDYECSSE